MILGGARSGKSAEAERRLTLLADDAVYVATGGHREGDADWAERVLRHRKQRPDSWETVETTDVAAVLRAANRPVLVDCLTLWLTAMMDQVGAWDDEAWRDGGERELAALFDELEAAWRAAAVPVLAVSNEVGFGIVPESAAVRRFRDEQGRLNQRIAAASDAVVLMVAGIAVGVK
ncbi:bifunctional adenosylcobinamide kinase/adenosylcobinamide-phosphate guanylyltransferase [Catenulispora rubra]|uniref:bifunctional adenosylcobinamide kinase/adenosylcobinamide-phosphate guanylyltransferase n=1 Tax=Catenulispora rubra TaxID=280293 RepID=UPI0018921937|nr:bifunctional adenosylcobinamide kinase/adenosylcobinamide-phosphate guanylyltransferase [Catenulispora rubra]